MVCIDKEGRKKRELREVSVSTMRDKLGEEEENVERRPFIAYCKNASGHNSCWSP